MKENKKIQEELILYKLCLSEFVEQLKEEYEEKIVECIKTQERSDKVNLAFNSGIKHGYYCALETLRNYASGFSLSLEEIGLKDEIKIG